MAKADTDAPALSRGLAVLSMLSQNGPQTLETLARSLAIPKASVFRLLSTLQQVGAVGKTAERYYEPLWVLQSPVNGPSIFQKSLPLVMKELVARTGQTVEWYEPIPEGMKLVRQEHPSSELYVKAGLGFVRGWKPELDAVAQLGHAFSKDAPSTYAGLRAYKNDGELTSLPATEALHLVHQARAAREASDLAYNVHGVRRHAVAAMQDGQFLGVLAVAKAYRFGTPNADAPSRQILREHLEPLLS